MFEAPPCQTGAVLDGPHWRQFRLTMLWVVAQRRTQRIFLVASMRSICGLHSYEGLGIETVVHRKEPHWWKQYPKNYEA